MSTTVPQQLDSEVLKSRIQRFRQVQSEIITQVRRIIVGQDEVLEQVMIALFVGGHCLITGLPGTAKTLLVRTLAIILGLDFKRIQFTPDLMPSDITGTDIIEEDPANGRRTWTFVQGPIFGNILLADELNRTPPKPQSALLEAMQERSCTVRGNMYTLPNPFFVLATQNPIELGGTYPLPEAQLDRFFFKALVPFPSETELLEIARRTTGNSIPQLEPVAGTEAILAAQQVARHVPIAEHVLRYAGKLIMATHPKGTELESVRRYVRFGASPRGLQTLVLGAKVRALLEGRFNVAFDDLFAVAHPALRHRIFLQFEAEADGMTADRLISEILEHTVKEPAKA